VFSSYEADDFRVPSPNPNDGSFLYQSIGTADGLSSIQIGFDWGAPDDANAGLEIGITIGIYAYDGQGGFIPADDVDVRGASGVTLLDSVSFTTTTTGIDGQIGTEIATLDLSGAGSQELFLRFNSFNPGNTESWPVLDNVHIVPEPAAMALFGLALAGLLGFRRNRRN